MANDIGRMITADAVQRSKALYPIDLAVADYDRTRPIIDGRVKAEGLALNTETSWIGDFCTRPVYEQYDAAEMSLSWYVAARCRGEPVIALPIFPLRMPVLAYVLVRQDAPFVAPRDLVGKRIGVPLYRLTVNLWLRGIFRDHYGLAPEDVTWVTCESEGAAGYVIPAGIAVEAAKGGTPDALLERGEVDAILVPQLSPSFLAGTAKLRRLFRDAKTEMRDLVRRTGIFPITHTVVMKAELAEREPWIAESLFRAFVEAQRQCDRVPLRRFEAPVAARRGLHHRGTACGLWRRTPGSRASAPTAPSSRRSCATLTRRATFRGRWKSTSCSQKTPSASEG